MNRRVLLASAFACVVAAGLLAASVQVTLAQTWPSRFVRVIVPAPPGGTLDIVMRILADDLQAALGQPVVIESKPGGAGMIGVNELLNSPRDGYTICIHNNGIVSEIPHIAKASYNPFTDIAPLIDVARSGLVFVGAPQLPVTTLKDAIAYVKANKDKVSYASYTAGTRSHVLGIQLNQIAGLDMTHVAYKGSPPALQDLMGNHVQFMFDGMATSLPLVQAKSIKALAVTSPERSPTMPDVPTFKELGYPDLTQTAWVGIFVPADFPEGPKERLRTEIAKILQKLTVRSRLAQVGLDPGLARTQAELAADLKAGYDSQGAILKSVDFKPE
jgi:tripartite-type tricarboxylate transporter receptor subunit TctC